MDSFGTHVPLVSAAISRSNGPILELGMGDYSTLTLNLFSKTNKVSVTSLEQNREWYYRFKSLNHEYHNIRCVNSYSEVDIDYTTWDIAFIDHAPAPRRIIDIERLKDKANIIIIHDTESSDYNYEKIWGLFKYRYDFKMLSPWTTAVSNNKARWNSVIGELCREHEVDKTSLFGRWRYVQSCGWESEIIIEDDGISFSDGNPGTWNMKGDKLRIFFCSGGWIDAMLPIVDGKLQVIATYDNRSGVLSK